jgi:AAA15 family ATPase/GTPase
MSNLKELMASLSFFEDVPKGYVNLKDFSALTKATYTEIRREILNGNIDRKNLIVTKHPKQNIKQIAIFWNNAAYPFIVRRRKNLWPKDFKQNEEHEYNPIPLDEKSKAISSGKKTSEREPIDLADAKLISEKLKIEKARHEIRLANNEVMNMKDVIAHNQEMAASLKGAVIRAITAAAPLVAASSDVRECNRILKNEFKIAFDALKQ